MVTPSTSSLGEFEQLVMLALVRLEERAYGVSIAEEIEQRTGRSVSLGAIYKTLERLANKGYVHSRFSEPTRERGGRRKRLYRLAPAGESALSKSLETLRRMTNGLRADWRLG